MTDSPQKLETAHVLFLDIVGYTRYAMDEQTRWIRQLGALVKQTPEYQRSKQPEELIRLHAGDGMALVFFRGVECPVGCAMSIARTIRDEHPELKLRMGVHSGPVYRLQDMAGSPIVAGNGINIAQRVMDAGDAGHILLSDSAAAALGDAAAWRSMLSELGACRVKHGEIISLFNLYSPDERIGNPAVPQKMAAEFQKTPPGSELPSRNSERGTRNAELGTPPPRARALDITLLYKRNAQPDEYVLRLLERELREMGHRIFIDRHLAVGVEWAREIEARVREADVVIPLLSPAALPSEMLAFELEIAHQARLQRNGLPRILPVRLDYEGPLPPSLAAILDPLEYTLWDGPEDDRALIRDLQCALDGPDRDHAHAAGPVPAIPEETPVGGVPPGSPFYVVRAADAEFLDALDRRESIVLINGARQMGKTSLLARGLQQARDNHLRVVLTDYQWLRSEHLESPDALFRVLAEYIADQLDLDVFPEDAWRPNADPGVNLQRYLRREVLAQSPTPLVWAMDEVDRLYACPFGSEVFGLFRSWHNARALDPGGTWSRLTLAIAYATEAHLFITDPNQSPFNVGLKVSLQDFNWEQVADLNDRYGAPLRHEAELDRFVRLVGGQPYLVRRGLHEMRLRGTGLEAFQAQADRDDGIFGDHLRRILVLLSRRPDLLEVVRRMLQGAPCPDPESFYSLRGAGIVAGESAADATLRCQLYATYLQRHLP